MPNPNETYEQELTRIANRTARLFELVLTGRIDGAEPDDPEPKSSLKRDWERREQMRDFYNDLF